MRRVVGRPVVGQSVSNEVDILDGNRPQKVVGTVGTVVTVGTV